METNRLNIERIKDSLKSSGRSQTKLAEEMGVSKESVSQWLKGEKHPRPALLLKLAKTLKLSFDEIVIKNVSKDEPIVAFRKKGKHKITPEYIENAKDMGRILRRLVPYLPFEELTRPRTLKEPINEYQYIQKVARAIKSKIIKNKNLTNDKEFIETEDLVCFFNDLNAVIVPVLWGDKKNHENALHVYLPDSMTTWIYLNLDCNLLDFKFWMAHELGHVLAPKLSDDEAEDFADAFAGALLFSENLASTYYAELSKFKHDTPYKTTGLLNKIAEIYQISPITIYEEINKFAKAAGKEPLDLEKNREIYKATSLLNKKSQTIGEMIFKEKSVSSAKYIDRTSDFFKTPFFEAVKDYMQKNEKSVSFLQNLLNISFLDAQSIYMELC